MASCKRKGSVENISSRTGRVLRSQSHRLCRVYILIPHPRPARRVHGPAGVRRKFQAEFYICIYTFCLHVLSVNF
jgi:hypothetical protein